MSHTSSADVMRGPGRVAGKVAVVTGGASGMGAAHVRRLAAEGATVVAADIADEPGQELAHALSGPGLAVSYRHHDVTSQRHWDDLVVALQREHGRIDILVNNAGVQVRSAGIDASDGEWDLVIGVNQRGTFLGMRAVIPVMARAGGGSVVNIASVAALVAMTSSIPYQASKAAVLAMTRAAALAYAGDHVRVNAVCPGLVVTGMTSSADPASVEALKARVPLGRDGRADEISSAVLFLASPESSYVTGAALPVDGGLACR
jgi:NAD(P)-dependent dehydrogenase (short-subunit alcohol dehydrogenase family)